MTLFEFWMAWAMAGTLTVRSGDRVLLDVFLTATMLDTAAGMFEAGIRPASHPTSTTKD